MVTVKEYIEERKNKLKEHMEELNKINAELNTTINKAIEAEYLKLYNNLLSQKSKLDEQIIERKIKLVSNFTQDPKRFLEGNSSNLKREIIDKANEFGLPSSSFEKYSATGFYWGHI